MIKDQKDQKDQKEIKARISSKAYAKFEAIQEELKKRGNTQIQFSDFLDEVFLTIEDHFFAQFLEKHTPLEHKIEQLIKDPSMREDLEKLLAKKSGKRKTRKERSLVPEISP